MITAILHSTVMSQKSAIKYLVVMVDNHQHFKDHITMIINNGNINLGFVRRNVLTTSAHVTDRVNRQLVRPHLEYAAASWDMLT